MRPFRPLVATGATISLGAALLLPFSAEASSHETTSGDVGIWYSTWYSKVDLPNRTWLQGFGGSSSAQFAADVTGDGLADAVTFTNGSWEVAASTGAAFATPSVWTTGHGSGSTAQLVGDVTGDGRADAVVFFTTDVSGDGFAGDWYVAVSTGNGFQGYSLWKSGLGGATTVALLGDVDGDGDADAVAVYPSTGEWGVATSNGSSFGPTTLWATGLASGRAEYFLADIDNDNQADAGGYLNGTWSVGLSSGTGFGPSDDIAIGHGVGSTARLLVDGNGDGFAEPYAYFDGEIGLPTGQTNPTGDGLPGDLVSREFDRASKLWVGPGVLNSGFTVGADEVFLAQARNDIDGWSDLISFDAQAAGGTWELQRYRQADTVSWNTWLGFGGKIEGPNGQPPIEYLPRTLGSYQQYDSSNPAVIDEHIAMISAAQIDYLLFDETNNLNNVSGAILNRAARVAARLDLWNQGANPELKYAFAIGGVQYSNDPETIENEARQTWEEFANDPSIGDDYYQLDGKPLLVVYTSKANQAAWLAYSGDKTASNRFTVRFASSDPSVTAGEYGWQLPSTGTVPDDEVMVAMAGWNNHYGNAAPIPRNKGEFYTEYVWDVILSQDPLPESVVINSFNEFGEDTAVQPADTSQLTLSEKWFNSNDVLDPDLYWDLTVGYVAQYKALMSQ